MDGLTMAMERGLLTLSQPPMLMLRQNHGMATMDGLTTVATGMGRGLPTLSQPLMLMLRLSHGMGTAMDGLTTVATGMERGLLMLSQSPMLMTRLKPRLLPLPPFFLLDTLVSDTP